MLQLPQNGPAPDPERQGVRLVRQLSAEDFGAAAAVVNESGAIWDPLRSATSTTP